jgi:hypothetical protein
VRGRAAAGDAEWLNYFEKHPKGSKWKKLAGVS